MTPTLDPARAARAARALAEGNGPIPGPEPGTLVVPSFTGDGEYLVDLRRGACTCPDALYRGETCKHLVYVALLAGLTEGNP